MIDSQWLSLILIEFMTLKMTWFQITVLLISWACLATGLAQRTCLKMSSVVVFGGTGLLGRECVYQVIEQLKVCIH